MDGLRHGLLELVFAALPFGLMIALVIALLFVAEQRQSTRQAEVARQIELTDALALQLGLLVAPVVQRRGRRWRISVAVPVGRADVVGDLIDTVDELFGRGAYELRLRPLAPPTAAHDRGAI